METSTPLWTIVLAAAFGLYLIPAILASMLGRRHAAWIWLVNLALGWTFAGWVAALIWAIRDKPRGTLS